MMTKYYFDINLFFIMALVIILTAGCRGETEKQRMVVAHYMVGMSMYRDAGEITIAGLKKDITDAHDQGVDAFQINIGGFSPARRILPARLRLSDP